MLFGIGIRLELDGLKDGLKDSLKDGLKDGYGWFGGRLTRPSKGPLSPGTTPEAKAKAEPLSVCDQQIDSSRYFVVYTFDIF